MKTILNIAWRNIWRHKLRSMVVIISIILGIWSGIFVSAFSFGLNDQRKDALLKNQFSHLQVHQAEWKDQFEVQYHFAGADKLQQNLAANVQVEASAARVIANGMANSAHYSGGVQIYGVVPEQEKKLTGLAAKIDSGNYFENGRNPILIGKALAEKLEVKPGSKVILNFTNEEQDLVSASFKVAGIYTEVSSTLEELKVYVQAKDLQELLGLQTDEFHEVAALLKDEAQSDTFKEILQSQVPDLLVENWKDLAPELAYSDKIMSQMLYIIIGIIMLALSFGIINTMLMAVLERRKELGVLMSVGMSKGRIFAMILTETLYLALLGGPLGVLGGYLTVEQTAQSGLSLAVFSDGLANYGIGTIIYPSIPSSFYFGTALIVFVMTLLAALYPARHALKLNPIETIRTI